MTPTAIATILRRYSIDPALCLEGVPCLTPLPLDPRGYYILASEDVDVGCPLSEAREDYDADPAPGDEWGVIVRMHRRVLSEVE